MRRAVLTLGSTAAGLAALLSFKSHSAAPAVSASAAPSASAPVASAPVASAPVASAGGTSSARPASSPARTHQPRHTGSPAAQTRTVTGAVTNTQYGPMQVRLTLVGTKITKATVLQRTDDGAESNQIDSFAIPKLESETLAAQSATIDAVSGASYTSSGYIRSLQSALDQVRG